MLKVKILCVLGVGVQFLLFDYYSESYHHHHLVKYIKILIFLIKNMLNPQVRREKVWSNITHDW